MQVLPHTDQIIFANCTQLHKIEKSCGKRSITTIKNSLILFMCKYICLLPTYRLISFLFFAMKAVIEISLSTAKVPVIKLAQMFAAGAAGVYKSQLAALRYTWKTLYSLCFLW